jgi:hypothetical protein
MGSVEAARAVLRIRAGADPVRERAAYVRFVRGSSEPIFHIVHHYYDPAFRDLLMQGQGPLGVHRALLSILAGWVFPRPKFSLRWRVRVFDLILAFHRRFGLVPPREVRRLTEMEPGPLPASARPRAATLVPAT